MARQTMVYMPIESFHECLRLMKKEKETFQLTSTTYTRKIKMDGYTVMFNEEGEPDNMMLCLINKVRKDARKFIGLYEEKAIDFFNMFQMPDRRKLITKVDVVGAYWNLSLNQGLVTEETNQFFIKHWGDRTVKEQKKVRTKALGSLATTRTITEYIEGKRGTGPDRVETELTKKYYTEVQRHIDDLMKQCSQEAEGCVYYYTDCMFVYSEFDAKVIEFFRKKKFDVSIGHTKLEYISVQGSGYLCSQADDIMYITRAEDGSHLPDLDEERWM